LLNGIPFNQLFSTLIQWLSGVVVTDNTIALRQRFGWVHIPRDESHAVKFKTASETIVRLRGGERLVLSLFTFSSSADNRAHSALTAGLEKIKNDRGMWTYERPKQREQDAEQDIGQVSSEGAPSDEPSM
jgi:hypothetical protein